MEEEACYAEEEECYEVGAAAAAVIYLLSTIISAQSEKNFWKLSFRRGNPFGIGRL